MGDPKEQVIPFTLQDAVEFNAKPLSGTISLCNGALVLKFDGYGDRCSEPGTGSPVIVELYNGDLRVCVWSDINQEDPTHTISLADAAEDKLKDEVPWLQTPTS